MFLALLLAASMGVSAQQTQKVSGRVVDSTGQPIVGAAVVVSGTTIGTVTDIDGNYTIDAPSNSKIEVSFIGYDKAQSPVAGQSTLNFTLQDEATELDELVVVGYGVQKRRDLTGSVASVTGEKLAANPVADVAQALQGQLPGVSVTSQDGRPGATMSIRVRGGGSITQSNDPLFIVDGVAVSDISDIPADNIESIDVLKDAASTAIYGARGANGVILVTTKGSKGECKTRINYNMYFQIKKDPETLETLDAYDYVLNQWSYLTAYGASYGDGVAKYFGLGSKYGNHLNEYKSVSTHNWVDDIMRTAYSWNHDLSLSGGCDQTKYYASIHYMNDEGIRIGTNFKRYGANVKVNHKITDNLTFDIDLRYGERRINGAKFDVATSAYRFRPIDKPLGEDDPTLLGMGSSNVELAYNPVDIIANYDNETKRQFIRGVSGLTWQAFKGFTAKTDLALRKNWSETRYWDAGLENGFSNAKLTKGDGFGMKWTTTINYQLPIEGDNHHASILAGNEMLESKSNSSYIDGYGYPKGFTKENAFGQLSMSDASLGKDKVNNTIGTPSRTVSWFGRVNYDFMSKYLLTLTFRADGSSKFAPNNHWGFFPAAAAAWRISDESFLEGNSAISNLKLRLSYGKSGSDNIDASLWKETWKTNSITVDGQPVTVYVPGDMMGNPDLKWETTTSRNIGIDYGFIDNKLHGAIEIYSNYTDDILMKVPIDASAGYSYQFQNVGKTSNKGFEVSLGYDIVRTQDFNLSFGLTYNYNKNNVEKLNKDALADTHTGWASSMLKPYYDYIIREGEPVGTIQGYKSEGFYTVDDFDVVGGVWTLKQGVPDISQIVNYAGDKSYNKPDGQTAMPGMAKFADINGDGKVNSDDMTVIGNTMPKHTGGFNFNGRWKGLDFALNFTYQLGGDVYNANAMHSMMGDKDTGAGNNRLSHIKDCWQMYKVGASGDLEVVTDPSELKAMNAGAKHAMPFSEYGITSSEFIEKATYLRLQTLTVGYTLPKDLTQNAKISKLRFYFTGGNLFCINDYSGLDPEVNTAPGGSDGFPTPAYDYNSYPKARTFTFGMNLSF
ncbi:MAG: TonB-dependent receptor [Bacteroidales bacterium]|nr:TonB-dependent receptor [Bacteroidales bacterium]